VKIDPAVRELFAGIIQAMQEGETDTVDLDFNFDGVIVTFSVTLVGPNEGEE